MLHRIFIGLFALLALLIAGCANPAPGQTVPLPTAQIADHRPTSAAQTPFPATLARVRLAFNGEQILDARLDDARSVLYVAESSGQLHVLDVESLVEVVTLPVSGRLTLDAEHDRLYVAQETSQGASIAIIDTATHQIIATLPGSHVAVDGAQNRLYVGDELRVDTPDDAPGVRLYDGRTLELLTNGEQPGIPVYNPLRNELLIVGYTVYTADPATLAVRDDLLPEISGQTLRWCNGCLMAQNATIFPAENLLALELTRLAAGGGAGIQPQPRFLDATTLAEDAAANATRSLQETCSSRRALRPSVEGRFYRSQIFQRYVTITNLSVVDEAGQLLTWRDGVDAGFINERTGQSYLSLGADGLRVLDLATLQPLGTLDATCVLLHDSERGRVYAARDGDLYVYGEEGGTMAPLPPVVEPLPAGPVRAITPSPAYDQDRTLFVTTTYGRIYRSSDGGESWARLRGGLPQDNTPGSTPEGLSLALAISPDFADDQTLFAGGHRSTVRGEGVWRSLDRGDTWQPMWRDLDHLRVDSLQLSPDFARDGTLLARATYDHLADQPAGGEAGVSLFRSMDRGLRWTLVATDTMVSGLPAPAALLPLPEEAPPLRIDATGRGIERRGADGAWESAPAPLRPESYVRAILPATAGHGVFYVVGEFDVARTADRGATWERWVDPRLANRDYANGISSAALSPPLDAGRHLLFIGTQNGEVWAIPWDAPGWEPVAQ
jgi:hypothetical protein